MRDAPDESASARWWCTRSLLWAFSSFALAASAYPVYAFAHALRRRGLADALLAVPADFVFGASAVWLLLCAAVTIVLMPAFLAWGAFAPLLRGAERSWAGLAIATALLAAVAVRIGASFFGAADWAPAVPAALVAWAALLLPRRLCRALRPGAFARGAA